MPDQRDTLDVKLDGNSPLPDLRVQRMRGVERFSEPYSFTLALVSDKDQSCDLSQLHSLLQSDATIRIIHTDHDGVPTERKIPGIITSVAFTGTDSDHCQRYEVELRPKLWLSSLNRHCRVFEQVKLSDVVQQVLGDAGLSVQVAATSATLASVLQYRESDLEFVERLLVTGGMYYYFKPDSADLVVHHQASGYGPAADGVKAGVFVDDGGKIGESGPGITDLRIGGSVVAAEVLVKDSSPDDPDTPAEDSGTANPRLGATGKATSAKIHAGDPGRWIPPGAVADTKAATIAADDRTAHQLTYTGCSSLPWLTPGRALTLEGELPQGTHTELVVVKVSHQWSEASGYNSSFEAAPASDPVWRPLPPASRPLVHGVRMAIVTDNKVEESAGNPRGSTIAQGVYKVKFPCDLDDTGQPIELYARMANPLAGNDRGLHLPLHVGDEVAVVHEHGDPDRPLIMGALFGKTNVSPAVDTKDGAAIVSLLRTRTGHELRFDEDDGTSAITLTGGKQEHHLLFDETNKKTDMLASDELKIEAMKKIEIICGEAKITMESNGDISIEGGNIKIKANQNLSGEGVEVAFKGSAAFKAEGAQAEVKGSAMTTIKGGLVQIN